MISKQSELTNKLNHSSTLRNPPKMPQRPARRELLGREEVRPRQRLRLSTHLLSERTKALLHEQLHRARGASGGTTNRLPCGVALAVFPVHTTSTGGVRQISKALQLQPNLLSKHLLLRRRTKALSTAKTKHSGRDHHVRPAFQRRLDQRLHR